MAFYQVLFMILSLHNGLTMSTSADQDLMNLDNNGGNSVGNVDHSRHNHHFTQTPVTEKCKAFFTEYSKYAGEFSHCELASAQPFRMCFQCVEQYAKTSSTYTDLITDNDLVECRTKYMKSDRVQIIPIVQQNMESIWSAAACPGCFEDVYVNHTTNKVHYDLPQTVTKFLEMYDTLSQCMNTSIANVEDVMKTGEESSVVCTLCLQNYTKLNDHYNSMADEYQGNVCMDIVDRMNYTRLMWSHQYNCSCRSSNSVPIIAIALIVASFPVLFYVILRVTSKEKKKKIVKQKRLTTSYSISRRHGGSHGLPQSLWRSASGYQSMRTSSVTS